MRPKNDPFNSNQPVSETTAQEIRELNKKKVSEVGAQKRKARRSIEDHLLAQELGVNVLDIAS